VMNWADMMKQNAVPASAEVLATHPTVQGKAAPTSWEPHEVWLTRVKVPRDHAAMLGEQARAESADESKPIR
jgi:hypothetical protein